MFTFKPDCTANASLSLIVTSLPACVVIVTSPPKVFELSSVILEADPTPLLSKVDVPVIDKSPLSLIVPPATKFKFCSTETVPKVKVLESVSATLFEPLLEISTSPSTFAWVNVIAPPVKETAPSSTAITPL